MAQNPQRLLAHGTGHNGFNPIAPTAPAEAPAVPRRLGASVAATSIVRSPMPMTAIPWDPFRISYEGRP